MLRLRNSLVSRAAGFLLASMLIATALPLGGAFGARTTTAAALRWEMKDGIRQGLR